MRPEAGAVKDEPVETNPNPNPNSNPKANPAIKRLTLALALAPSLPPTRSILTRSGTSTSSQPS